MDSQEFKELLHDLGACSEAYRWADGKSFKEVFETCERGDWLLWLFGKMKGKDGWPNLRQLTLAKAKCAMLVKHLMKDERSVKAVEVAYQFGVGNATRDELNAAYAAAAADDADAAYAAYAAAYAAADDADAAYAAYAAAYAAAADDADDADAKRKEVLSQCADICREVFDIAPIIK